MARPLPGRGEALLEIKRIIEMSADAVEDTAVELSTANERQRIERAHEYGLIAVVPTRAHLDYILAQGICHSPYDKHKKWGLRLRADFILFMLSETSFPGQSGVACEVAIKSVHFGERREIGPQPPASSQGAGDEKPCIWFRLENPKPVVPLRK